MTTEEAIRILNEMLSKTAYGGSSELGGLAVKKAVEALRRQEEPVSEDLEEAAKENAKIERSDDTEVGYDINRFGGFIEGAKWDRKHIWHDATEEPVEEEYPIIVIDSANCVYLIDKDDSEPFDSKDKWLSVHDILPKKD